MKLLKIIGTMWSLVLCVLTLNAQPENIKQTMVNSVQGDMPYRYDVVLTTIEKNPAKPGEAEDPNVKPIITRSVIGTLDLDKRQVAIGVNQPISVPKKEITYQSNLPEYLAKIIGMFHPKAAAIAGAAQVLTNEALRIAGDEMTKFYGNDPTKMQILEIIPKQYYRIINNKIETTTYFEPALKEYHSTLQQYLPIAQDWNKVIVPYEQKHREYQNMQDKNSARAQQLKTDIKNTWENQVKPLLEKKGTLEAKLSGYALNRIAIMPSMYKPTTSCSQVGYHGPWSLSVFMYVGAKQTNIFNVEFCAVNPNQNPQIIVELVPNSTDEKLNFKTGGVRITTPDAKSTLFPAYVGAQREAFQSKSRILGWHDEMITKADAGSIDEYMFPFDVNKLRADYQNIKDIANKEQHEKNLKILDEAVKSWKGASTDQKADSINDVRKPEDEQPAKKEEPKKEEEPAAEPAA